MTAPAIAVLGNSHAAALRFALDEAGGNFPGLGSLTFFARPAGSGGIDSLEREGDALVARDPALIDWLARTAGTHRIEAHAYDAFLLHGLTPDASLIQRAVAALDGRCYGEAFTRVYLEDFRAAVAWWMERSEALAIGRMLRGITGAPVFATLKPLRARAPGEPCSQIGSTLYAAYAGSFAAVLADAGCTFLPQPSGTVVDGYLTDPRFAAEDGRHMTAAYGELVLADLAAALRQG